MTRRTPLALLALLLLAAAAPARPVKEWTVLCYFVGDDDGDRPIEDSQIDDLLELDSIGTRDQVNLLVQMDRGKKLTRKMKQYYSDPNESGGLRYRIDRDKWVTQEKLGEVNSGDPKVLYDALAWAAREYPAKRYALIINAHGSGVLSWRGVGGTGSSRPGEVDFDPFTGYDDTDGDCLTVFEVRAVLDAFRDRLNGGRALDLLGFDSCFSLMVEVLFELRHGAQVIVGSPNLVPGTGYDYRGTAAALVRNPTMGAEELGKVITRTFIDSVGSNRKSQVLGAWRSSGAEGLLSALSRLTLELERARREHGAKLSFSDLTSYNDRYWDLGRVLAAIRRGDTGTAGAPNFGAIRELAEEVEGARRAAMVSLWYDGNFARNKVGGVALYWPDGDEYRKYRDFYKALEASREGRWDEFLDYRELGL